MAGGLTDEELRALRLLTRVAAGRSEAAYLAHIDLIARSSGSGVVVRRWGALASS